MGNIAVYTDGGCSGNPGPGAWAFVIKTGRELIRRSGGEPATTNNRMELSAVINALEFLQSHASLKGTEVHLYTDSQYVKKGITEWIERWKAVGWKNASKKPVKNQDLWKHLLALRDRSSVHWNWVPGHSGDELNELCDRLVNEKMREMIRGG